MDLEQAKQIEAGCVIYVYSLCLEHKIAPDHGFEHALHVASLARLGLSDFEDISILQALLVLLASLLHDIDDYKIFKTKNYANATKFLDATTLADEHKHIVLKMISLVSYSKNKNTIPDDLPKWMLIPRDADRLTGGGRTGIERTLAFNENNAEYGRCLLVVDDRKMFASFPVTAEDIQSKFDYRQTKKRSLFEFYITDWSNRGVCASGSPKLQKLFISEYRVLLEYWVDQINSFNC